MLVAGTGVLTATTLLATVPIYTSSMSNLGLQFGLERGINEPRDRIISATAFDLVLGDPVDLAKRDALVAITETRLGYLADEIHMLFSPLPKSEAHLILIYAHQNLFR